MSSLFYPDLGLMLDSKTSPLLDLLGPGCGHIPEDPGYQGAGCSPPWGVVDGLTLQAGLIDLGGFWDFITYWLRGGSTSYVGWLMLLHDGLPSVMLVYELDWACSILVVHEDGRLSLKHKLIGHRKPVSMVAWSPDDCQLLTCGTEEVVRRWDASTGTCLNVYEKAAFSLISCGWFPDGKQLFSGVTDRSICIWDLEGTEIESWKGRLKSMASDMAITKDHQRIISMYKENVIMLLDRETKTDKLIQEEQTITSFTLSHDNNFLLVNLTNQEIHLWSIKDDPRLVKRYKGHKRSRFLIRSCFGGIEQAFIASGSEDSQVYIWHRNSGNLVEVLPGHSSAVNCVSWNPTNPHMLASASDDYTIRIWGLSKDNLKCYETHSNGVAHCNGNSK
ncbi:hypothetical protein ZIOFF_010827 [Zingiber officinale]|uniref:Uncharacterized protein n=1 Tax=Zingiber officinale TaxID=94328 RepID=A0A8J5HJQ8_ZINOF|nr:hypothetical protein ZIOFF_010827 [Zingiber officinale]